MKNIFSNSNEKQSMVKKYGIFLNGKTLGIIGLGSIGKTFIRITKGLILNIVYDINQDKTIADNYGVKYCELNELLATSDIVSIHLV